MTTYRNNAPTMTDSEIALWEQRVTSGRLFSVRQAKENRCTVCASPAPSGLRRCERHAIRHRRTAEHGTLTMYTHHSCRCDACRQRAHDYYVSRRDGAA